MRKYSPDHVALGDAIRALRQELGISQEELAARCKLDRTYMGGIERGERNLSYAKILVICRALDVPASRLLRDAERLRAEG